MNHAELKCRLLLPSVRCILTVRMALRRHTHALDGCPRPSSRKKCRLLWEHVQRPKSSLHLHWGKMQAALPIGRHRVSTKSARHGADLPAHPAQRFALPLKSSLHFKTPKCRLLSNISPLPLQCQHQHPRSHQTDPQPFLAARLFTQKPHREQSHQHQTEFVHRRHLRRLAQLQRFEIR